MRESNLGIEVCMCKRLNAQVSIQSALVVAIDAAVFRLIKRLTTTTRIHIYGI